MSDDVRTPLGPPRPNPGLAGTLGLSVLALASFLAVAGVIRPLVPWPLEYGLRAKVEYYRAHREEFDTLYVGSSYTFRSCRPDVIDPALAQRGLQQTSFNLGVNGAGHYEVSNLLEELLDPPPARLRLVLLEVASSHPGLNFASNTFENRGVFWHTTRQTVDVLRATLGCKEPPEEKARLAWAHLKMWARRFTNYARGPEIVRHLAGLEDTHGYLAPEVLEQGRGWQDPATSDDPADVDARKAFLKAIPQYRELVAEIEQGNRWKLPVAEVTAELAAEQLAWLESRGLQVVHYVPAGTGPSPEPNRLHELGVLPHMLAFNRPEKYPELYEVEARHDRGHLSAHGGRVFSLLLVRELAPLLERLRGTPAAR